MKEFSLKKSLVMLVALFVLGACSTVGGGDTPVNPTDTFKSNIADKALVRAVHGSSVSQFTLNDGKIRNLNGVVEYALLVAHTTTNATYTNSDTASIEVVINGETITLGDKLYHLYDLEGSGDNDYNDIIFKAIVAGEIFSDYTFNADGGKITIGSKTLDFVEATSITNATYFKVASEIATVTLKIDDDGFVIDNIDEDMDDTSGFLANIENKVFTHTDAYFVAYYYTKHDSEIRYNDGSLAYKLVYVYSPTEAIYESYLHGTMHVVMLNEDSSRLTVSDDHGDGEYLVKDFSDDFTRQLFYNLTFNKEVTITGVGGSHTYVLGGSEIVYSYMGYKGTLSLKEVSSLTFATYVGDIYDTSTGNIWKEELTIAVHVTVGDDGYESATIKEHSADAKALLVSRLDMSKVYDYSDWENPVVFVSFPNHDIETIVGAEGHATLSYVSRLTSGFEAVYIEKAIDSRHFITFNEDATKITHYQKLKY